MKMRVPSRVRARVTALLLLRLRACFSQDVKPQEDDEDDEDVMFKTRVPGVRAQDWISSSRVLLDGDKHVGFIRARVVNYIKTSEVIRLPYPLQMRCVGLHSYFIPRETWGWSDFLMNPMVLMMVLPLLIILLLPKVFNPSDPEMRREMEQSMNMLNSNQELPDVSELMTKFFSLPKSHGKAEGGARGHRGGAPAARGGASRRKIRD